jgi:gliding motility-associated-like protein
MKLILQSKVSLFIFSFLLTSQIYSQTFWAETFGTGCNTGTVANGFISPNGEWLTRANGGVNGANSNDWYISAAENGEGVGNCGAGCGTNPTLHVSPYLGDLGATYLADDGGIGLDPTTDLTVESPFIDCSGQCGVELSFEYMENGDGTNDNMTFEYFDGSTWTILDDPAKTPLTCAPQGEWTQYTFSMPASADNNPFVKIGFRWVNNNDAVGTDPSAAIYNIQLASTDVTPPTITCAGNVDVYIGPSNCEAQVPDLVLPPDVVVSDNCTSTGDLIVSQDIPSATPIIGHNTTITVNVTVEDLSGNTNTCAVDVTALDTVRPAMICPSTQTVFADASCSGTLDDYLPLATISDNCSAFADLTISQVPVSGTVINSDQTIVLEATDEYGNTGMCSFLVDLVDTTAPVITCPGNQVQNVAAGLCDTLLLDYTSQVSWSDNCITDVNDMTFTQTPAPLTTISGVTSVQIVAEDLDGNTATCNFDVEVIDNEDPVITCPADLTIATDANCEIQIPDFIGAVGLTDNCSASSNITLTQNPAIGTIISGVGTVQTITMTAEDEVGNTSSCTFDVTLSDTMSPIVTCPLGTIPENTTTNCEFTVPDYSSNPSVTDNCYTVGDLTFSQDVSIGSTLTPGVYVVNVTAEDPDGNSASCGLTIEVVDGTSPTITTCASDQIENAGNNCEANIGDYTSLVAATDNCDVPGDLTITQSPSVGTIINSTTIVTITVADQSGNITTCDLEVTLNDNVPPLPDCSNDSIVLVNSSCEYGAPDVTGIITGTDNCSAFGDMTITQDIAPGTTLTGSDQIEITLADENGNSATCLVDVIPDDQVAPSISCPADQTLNNGTSCDYNITDFTSLAIVSDNCPNVVVSQVPAVGTAIGTGTHEVTLVATDPSGNTDACTFLLTVFESVSPTIVCPSDISACDPIVTYPNPVVTENCNGFILTQTDISGLTSGDQFPIGITTQSFEVADSSGNMASCSFDIEILEYPDVPVINTLPTGLCDTTSTSLNADSPVNGTGEWSVSEGGAIVNNLFANATGANNMTYGDNTFVWTVSTASCGSLSDSVTIIVYEVPLPASTQDTLYVCGDSSVSISANQPSAGTGVWSTENGVALLDTVSPNTLAYNLAGGWNNIAWTISNGTCPVTSDTMVVFSKENSVIFNEDTTVCITDEGFELEGTATEDDVNSIWYVITGGADISNSTTSNPFFTNIKGGENIIVFGQSHSVCPTTLDTIRVIGEQCGDYDPVIPTVITPNDDGKNDLFIVDNLNILFPESQIRIVNRWGDLVFESEGYEIPWNGTLRNEGNQLPVGTYFYRIILNDDNGTEITGPISIIR